MCYSFSLAATSLLIQGKQWSCMVVVVAVVAAGGGGQRGGVTWCSAKWPLGSYQAAEQINREIRGSVNFTGCPRSARGDVKTWSLPCYCIVIHTCLMTPDYHSHANASVVIGVTRVRGIMSHYLYLSCQLLIALSHCTSLLIWHAVSNSLLIIFKQIWGDKNQFSIILEVFFFHIHLTLRRGLERLAMHDWAHPE